MYELIQLGEKTYYVNCPSKVGLYKISETEIALIDSGNDKDAAKKILKHIESLGCTLKMIINTHSHADHVGGNELLQQRTGCKIYCAGVDRVFVENPILEPSYLFGGYPFKALRNKFLMAKPSICGELTQEMLPAGLQILPIDGHTFSQVTVKTDDDVWFLADCLNGENIIEKYHITFLHDVKKYLASLDAVMRLEGKHFVPAHAEACGDIKALCQLNIDKTHELIALVKEKCQNPIIFEELLKQIFDHYALILNAGQYVLVGSTIKCYLAYLIDEGEMEISFAENRMYWQSK